MSLLWGRTFGPKSDVSSSGTPSKLDLHKETLQELPPRLWSLLLGDAIERILSKGTAGKCLFSESAEDDMASSRWYNGADGVKKAAGKRDLELRGRGWTCVLHREEAERKNLGQIWTF